MSNHIYRSYKEPKRVKISWEERWRGHDRGLINCWEVGRELSTKKPDLAVQAKQDELPVLRWKGGVPETKNRIREKYGSLNYLAQWQGLCGIDLDIDLSTESELICTKTGTKVIYTGDVEKLRDDDIVDKAA